MFRFGLYQGGEGWEVSGPKLTNDVDEGYLVMNSLRRKLSDGASDLHLEMLSKGSFTKDMV